MSQGTDKPASMVAPAARSTPLLLEWRLTALEINPKDIERGAPDVFASLKTACTLCKDKRRCLEDMMDYMDPPGWQGYCPNAATIRKLL